MVFYYADNQYVCSICSTLLRADVLILQTDTYQGEIISLTIAALERAVKMEYVFTFCFKDIEPMCKNKEVPANKLMNAESKQQIYNMLKYHFTFEKSLIVGENLKQVLISICSSPIFDVHTNSFSFVCKMLDLSIVYNRFTDIEIISGTWESDLKDLSSVQRIRFFAESYKLIDKYFSIETWLRKQANLPALKRFFDDMSMNIREEAIVELCPNKALLEQYSSELFELELSNEESERCLRVRAYCERLLFLLKAVT